MKYEIEIKRYARPWTPLATTFPTKKEAKESKQYCEAVKLVLKGQLQFVRIRHYAKCQHCNTWVNIKRKMCSYCKRKAFDKKLIRNSEKKVKE